MTGNKKFVNLLCRFSDTVNVPKPASYFEQMFVSTYPGLDHYWRELSYNQMNIDGTVTIGWLDLPHPYSHYYSGGIFNTIAFNQDCGQAAEPLVYFPDFYGINFMGSDNITPGWGGIGSSSYPFSFDGVTRLYGVTWIPPIGYNHQSVVAHEMGHSLCLPHSSGGYGTDYDSKWDVMSSTYGLVQSPPFRDIGQHTISHHKDLLGWIPYGRTFNAPVNGANAINLAPLSTTSLSTRNHLMAKIPLRQNGGDYYTVEVRNLTGYDQSVPAKAVVLHKVSGGGNATVVDIDNNNDPNDAAAQWLPGEVFNDSVNRIRVTINSETFGSFNVTIERNVDCTFSLNPASASFPALGGNGQVEVITQSGCYWELSGAGTYRDFATGETLQIYDAPFVPPYVGLAEDYPSTVTVSGISGTVSKLRLRIYRMTHTAPGDVDMILIAPNGTSSMIMSDAGANTDINGSEFVFDQFAGKPLDEWDHNPSGTYLPTDYDHGDDIFPAPGPGTGSFKLGLDRFNNLNPNGEWKLFVVDDTNGESGYLARGWALEVTDQPVLAETFSGTGSATINYAVTRNYGAARQLTLNIGGQNFIISQGGV